MSLGDTGQRGEREREEWLSEVASISRSSGERAARAKVRNDVEKNSNLATEKSKLNAISEGNLAADGRVCFEFERLRNLRDQAWNTHGELRRKVHHGPSQVLIDLLRRQKKLPEQKHAKDLSSYTSYILKFRRPDLAQDQV